MTHTTLPIETLTFLSAKTALDLGCAAIRAGNTVFDLGNVKAADSSGVAVLLAWQRKARAAGTTLSFVNLPASIESLATLYGVEGFLINTPANLHHH